ncbi:hypothetical protein, partial [Planktothrix sp.]|uniref:hypothetical protein n=1 Tax=Planktothrix sp. TaxID=3088171 RepID=UPI0038D44429
PTKYLNISQWLYASYRNFSESHGSKPISSNRFSSLLHDLLKNQLKLDIFKGRDRNGSYFENIRIRSESDDTPPLISSVTASVTGVTASVTAETLISVECDGCDGFSKKLADNSLSSSIEKNQIDNNVDKGKSQQNPSQPSQTQQNQAIGPSQEPSQTHHRPITNPSQPSQTPQIGIIYLDPQGFPHKIVERDDSGRWRDQHGDNITPGVFRTYKKWTKQEGEVLLNSVQEALTNLENGNNKLIENLLNHAPTKAQMNIAKIKIKSYIGDDKFNLLQNYSKSRKG